MILEEKKCFVCGNIYSIPGNCHAILEGGYTMTTDEEG